MRPAIRLISVVLPDPENPTMATNSLGSMLSETFLSTCVRALPAAKDLLTDLSSRMAIFAPSGRGPVRKERLQRQHHAVEQEADDTDRQHRYHDLGERRRGSVLELVPNELPQPRILRQHLGGDQNHPSHAQRKTQPGEDQRQGRWQHELDDRLRPAEAKHATDVA